MSVVHVDAQGGAYPIHIAAGRLAQLADTVPADTSAIAIVTNPTVAALYLAPVKEALVAAGKPVHVIELPDGEAYKTWESLNLIFDALLGSHLDRKALIVALGGGVIGDMAGFAAACFMRGVRFVQVPTTLLAQVDSSVGGKTAINHPLGKNMVGAFYQPIAVEIDTDVLRTLPAREISAGLAEVIKYGMIYDLDFFNWCEEQIAAMRRLDQEQIAHAIRRSCEVKAEVVSQDERESGLRAILNFGHTFGHAIESGMGYGQWLHGEAVGCGMIMAAELSHLVCGLPAQDVARIKALVQASGCPVTPPQWPADRWLQLMQVDKKNEGGQLRFVLLDKLAHAKVQAVAPDVVRQALARFTTVEQE
ncbi:3-dehydroquinate synthase [Alcaligenes ammonioxydans]|uniref:3-dehydroquinate synthase n=1 Tax=Alcaligenes ammonioxydans TaxID=2582914 RepID=UPI00075048B1|nr:3-dehydroquinate synthase [Alcaligenes faecalis]